MASQDFETNFICWKEIDNRLIALKRPNILVTWNTDTGKIISYHKLHGYNFNNYVKHTEWNGMFVLKKQKELSMNSQKSRQKTGLFKQETEDKSDDSYDFDNESGKDVDADLEQYAFSEKNPNNLIYTLVDIKNPYELE